MQIRHRLPVRDGHDGRAGQGAAQRGIQRGFGFGIQAGGGLVQKQPVRPGQQGTRDGHTLLLAHGKAVQLYRAKYQPKQGGKIGMALWSEWSEPFTSKAEGTK